MKSFAKSFFAVVLCVVLMAGFSQVFASETAQSGETEYKRMIIQEAGTYVLTGSMHGSVYVDPGAGDVILVLDNVDIDGGDEPGIMAVSGDRLKIEIADHTVNRIADGPDNPWQAAIYTEVDTVLDGNCRLVVEGRSGYGIVTKDADFTVDGGKGLVLAEKSGFKADGEAPGRMVFRGGTIYVNAKEGIFAEGTVSEIAGGVVEATALTDISQLFPECAQNAAGCVQTAPGCVPCTPCSVTPPYCEKLCDDCDLEPTTDTPTEFLEGVTSNSAASLEPDYEHAIRIVLSDDNNQLSISAPGTYIVSGNCSDGRISIEKETVGVVLVLENLNLTNVTGPALMINDEAVVKIIVEDNVRLATGMSEEEKEEADSEDTEEDTEEETGEDTEEDTEEETGEDTEEETESQPAAAAIMGGDNTSVVLTGNGNLLVDGGEVNGISMGEESSLVIDGDLNIFITAEENGITSEYDVAVTDGNLLIDAGEAGIHADRVITVGDEERCGPGIVVADSEDGLEATVINVESGHLDLHAEKDGMDLEEGMYDDELEASADILGGTIRIEAGEQGIESDGNVNLIDGVAVIDSEEECVEADDELYVSEDFEIYTPCSTDPCEPGKG